MSRNAFNQIERDYIKDEEMKEIRKEEAKMDNYSVFMQGGLKWPWGDKGRVLRDEGIAKVTANGKEWIQMARALAIRIAKNEGQVSINEVREAIKLPINLHPNTFGAVLKCPELKAFGYTQAKHPGAHARVIRTYKLK